LLLLDLSASRDRIESRKLVLLCGENFHGFDQIFHVLLKISLVGKLAERQDTKKMLVRNDWETKERKGKGEERKENKGKRKGEPEVAQTLLDQFPAQAP